jgi:hypothetical protein
VDNFRSILALEGTPYFITGSEQVSVLYEVGVADRKSTANQNLELLGMLYVPLTTYIVGWDSSKFIRFEVIGDQIQLTD